MTGLARVALLALALLALALACSDDPPPAPADAAAPATSARSAPRSTPPPAPPAKGPDEPRPRVVPLETAADLRSALRGAMGSMSALWTMVDPAQGLSTRVADDGSSRHQCRLEEGPRVTDFPYMLDSGDRWSCDEALTRCTSVDVADGSGYSFHLRASDGPRRLAAIVRYSGTRVPAEDPPDVAAFVAAAGTVCRLRAVVAAARAAAPPEADMPTELWSYRHPLQGADDDTPEGAPEERRLCGDEARRAAATLLHELGALREPTGCEHAPLSCTYSAPFAERRVFARIGAAGRPVPWAVADLASLPSPDDAAREARDVAAFLRRAESSPCP